MAIEDALEKELRRAGIPDTKIEHAKNTVEILKEKNPDANLVTVLLADQTIKSKTAVNILKKAGVGRTQRTSYIGAVNDVKRALTAMLAGPDAIAGAHEEIPADDAQTIIRTKHDSATKAPTMKDGLTNLATQLHSPPAKEKQPARPASKQFTIISKLGEGGMGSVYKARDNVMNRIVAIKTLRKDLPPGKREEYYQYFVREIRATGSLEYENIVRAYSADRNKLVLEFAPGETLEKKIDKLHEGKIPLRKIMQSFWEICDAVQKTHKAGYIHRDIKPANALVTNKIAKLSDFGLTATKDEIEPGEIVGTTVYMSPEQASGEPTEQSDVWSLGVMLYEILTNELPFEGETALNTIFKITSPEIKPKHPARYKGGIERPPELCEIAMKALQKDVEERYQTAQELADDVKAWLEYKPVSVYKDSTKEAIKKTLKRKPWIKYVAGAAAGVLALGLAIGGPVLYISESKASRKAEQAQISQEKAEQADQERQKAEQAEKQAKEAKQKSEKEQAERAEKRRLAMDEYQKGLDFVRRRDYENAERYFDKAITINDLADAHFEKGLIKYSNFDGFEAVKEFERANQSSKKESKQIHKPAIFYAGFVNVDHLENPAKATEYFNQLITEANDDSDYYVMLSKSLIAFTEEKYDEAIQLADKATQQYSKAWECWLLRALYRMQGIGGPFSKPGLLQHRNFEEAFHSLDKALEINPGQIRCLERRIKLNCGMLRNMDQTLENAQQLVDDHPTTPFFRTILGTVHYFRNEYEKSLETLQMSEQMNDQGSSHFAFQALSHLRIAEENPNKREYHYRKSEEYYTKAISRTPYADQIAGRAYIRTQLNNLEEALEDIRAATTADPNNGRAHFALAVYYVKKGKPNQAIQEFENAIKLKFYEAYRELGLLYIDLKKKEQALETLNEYIKKGIPYRRQEIIKKIQEIENK